MSYKVRAQQPSSWRKIALIVGAALVLVAAAGGLIVRHLYLAGLKPVHSQSDAAQSVIIESGATLDQITRQLEQAGLIKSGWAFKWYVGSQGVRSSLQAGTYSFSPSQTVAEIVVQLSHGKVKTDLVAIIPGQRLDQIRTTLLNYGFEAADVDRALDPATHAGHPLLADKPARASLEGLIYPDSYQKDATTTPQAIVAAGLDEMDAKLTTALRTAFAKQKLSTYQAITLASIVEREVSRPADRPQVAQVFLKRLRIDMALESNATDFYYNTYRNPGLPPTPISNVTLSALQAVANPAATDWLYFVSGDDGTTHFSKTFAEHEAKVIKYCTKLCNR